jgi:amino acid adenylation domain-containing protein
MIKLLNHLLSESAARRPEREAVRFGEASLTYAELDALTNQLARTLLASGLKPGDRVGIYVHKSLSSVVGVFGILKVGGVYVPLDPSAPVKRLAYITRDCEIKVLVTSTEMLPNMPEFFSEGLPLEVLVVTDGQNHINVTLPLTVRLIPWTEVTSQDNRRLQGMRTTEDDLAYILYTSGSTGEPKGVMISHRTIFTFIDWCYATFRMTENDRVTSHAPLHFDLSTFDIYVTIKAGGTVVLVPEGLSVFPVQLADLLQKERITVTYLVPSILSMMVNYGRLHEHDFSALRAILFAGEVFPIKYLRQLKEAIPHAEYYNLYGPTETNVCTYYKVQAKDVTPDSTEPVPIGAACENIEVFAVNDEGHLVKEPGQEGELWACGPCVAQGYWGDRERTAKSFRPAPIETRFDGLAYRTGDIVTLDQDGVNWRYVGRRDHMIKSRGYRIELGEIEAALIAHGDVREAAVIAIPDELIGNRIKAFVVSAQQDGLTAKEIEVYCAQRLPRYMLPESIEFLDQLPKTSTGKIDRTLLARKVGSSQKRSGTI